VTSAGLTSAGIGFALGWALVASVVRLMAAPFRGRRASSAWK
jgi:hypothetical protein